MIEMMPLLFFISTHLILFFHVLLSHAYRWIVWSMPVHLECDQSFLMFLIFILCFQHDCCDFFFRIIAASSLVEKERSRRLGTSLLNQVIQEAIRFKPPPKTRGGKRGRVYYATQVGSTLGSSLLYFNLL